MFDDILGKPIERDETMNSISSDSKPTSFSEIWAAKQREIDAVYREEDYDDDFEDEYECLQV